MSDRLEEALVGVADELAVLRFGEDPSAIGVDVEREVDVDVSILLGSNSSEAVSRTISQTSDSR